MNISLNQRDGQQGSAHSNLKDNVIVLSPETKIALEKIKNENICESRRIIRNVIVISLVFMTFFTATSSPTNLLSSLYPEGGLGVYVRATSNAAAVLSTLFLPTFVIGHLTTKWTLIVGMTGTIFTLSAQLYPTFATMIPASVLAGSCYPLLWAAKCTYITNIAQKYATLTGKNFEDVITRFFGIFFFFFQTSKIWGSIIPWQILTSETSMGNRNRTAHCGIHFCPTDAQSGDVLLKPSQSNVNLLLIICIGVGVLSFVIGAVFVDSLERFVPKEAVKDVSLKHQLKPLVATLQELKTPLLILLLPLTFWCGFQQAFYSADFHQAFITCELGIEALGYIGICYGICNAIGSYVFSVAVRQFGRIPVFIFGALLNVGAIAAMFSWKLDPESNHIFFSIAALWAVADSIWQTQINALYGVIFPEKKEAAFSNYRLWTSLGSIVAFLNVDLLCVRTKMFILIGILATGMLGYFVVEYLLKLHRNKPRTILNQSQRLKRNPKV